MPELWTYSDDDEKAVFDELRIFLFDQLAPPGSEPETPPRRSQDPGFDLDDCVFEHVHPLWQKLCACYGLEFGDEESEEETDE